MKDECACGCGGKLDRANGRKAKQFLHGHWSRTPEAKAFFAARRVVEYQGNPTGLCQCGCGEPTKLSKVNRPPFYRAGEPRLFRPGHHFRLMTGPRASGWKGGRYVRADGYVYVLVPEHPAATKDGYVLEHRYVAEQTLGRPLYAHEAVHHINGVKTDNRAGNLQVMTRREHARLHPRQALDRYFETHDRKAANSAAGKKGAAARWRKSGG